MSARQVTPSRIGNTSLAVTRLGLGGAALGNIYQAVTEQDAQATIDASWDVGQRYFDTAPLYGFGLSEQRLGVGLAERPRDQVVISTKAGYALREPGTQGPGVMDVTIFDQPLAAQPVMDFSREATLRGVEESLARLRTDRLDIVYIHDADESVATREGGDPYARSHFKEAMAGVYPTLMELKSQGVITAVGVGMNQWQMLVDFAREAPFDCFMVAGRYTLIDQTALPVLLPLCLEKKISVVIAGPYASGILATGPVPGAHFNYLPADQEILGRVKGIQAVCRRHKVPLQAAALQFPFGHPAVVAAVPGGRSATEVQQNAAFLNYPIPDALWSELQNRGLIEEIAPVPAWSDG